MERQKKKQKGITLIALVISIIVMLILAGVSLNMTIGENGIIKQAQKSKTVSGLASLQEQMYYLRVEKMKDNDGNSVQVFDFSYEDYPSTGFLRRVNYGSGETYVFDMNYMDRVSSELAKSLTGGYGVNESIYQLKDVYGINADFTVWYRDSNGILHGVDKILEIAIDPSTSVRMSIGLMESMGLTSETANVGNTRGVTDLLIDGSLMTDKITNLNDLSLMPNLKWLKLKNLELTDVEGLQYLVNLDKITFDNTTVESLEGLKYANMVTGFYLINGSVTDNNMVALTSSFSSMPKLTTVRIRNNPSLTIIPALTTLGGISELRIEENPQLTNIYGLSTVQDKSHLQILYLNENDLTDVVNTTNLNESYGYKLPLLQNNNVINMSYLNDYNSLKHLNLNTVSINTNNWYEDGSIKKISNLNNNKINYLCGITSDNQKKGIINLNGLQTLQLKNCDILDIDVLESYKNKPNYVLNYVNVLNSDKLQNAQINAILPLSNKITFLFAPKYVTLLDTLKPTLSFSKEQQITDFSFLAGNTVTKSLTINNNNYLDDEQIGYIGSMTQLTELNIQGCLKITDFSWLANLTNLKRFNACDTKISDEDFLLIPNKEKLIYTICYQCKNVNSTSWLSQFPNLSMVDFRRWGVPQNSDLSFLNNMKITNILFGNGDLSTCQEAINKSNSYWGVFLASRSDKATALKNCKEISYLRMYSDGLNNIWESNTDYLDLSTCINLKEIYFERNCIEKISTTNLNLLSKVTIFNMQNGSRSSVTDFSTNKNLSYLNLSKNYYTQDDLITLTNYIKPTYNNEKELISGCPLLTTLYLNNNQFSSLSPLSNIPSVEKLYITDNQLVTLTGIENLTNLNLLDIRNNPAITNIQAILDLKAKSNSKLTTVYVSGCVGISSEMIEQMRNAGINIVE